MLLFDQDGRAQSIQPQDATAPFIREWFGNDVTRVRAFLDWYPHDLAFITAIVEELRRCLASPENNLPYPQGLIDAAARAIADGLISVATMLPDKVAISFAANAPSAPWGPGTIAFGNASVAQGFLLAALQQPQSQAALAGSLQHPLARRQGYGNTAATGASLVEQLAGLLLQRQLALFAADGSRLSLRLVWAEHAVPPTAPEAAPAAPPPQAAAPPPPPPQQSSLPDPPSDVSPQAQALIDAAAAGVPFCEECARRAMEQSNA